MAPRGAAAKAPSPSKVKPPPPRTVARNDAEFYNVELPIAQAMAKEQRTKLVGCLWTIPSDSRGRGGHGALGAGAAVAPVALPVVPDAAAAAAAPAALHAAADFDPVACMAAELAGVQFGGSDAGLMVLSMASAAQAAKAAPAVGDGVPAVIGAAAMAVSHLWLDMQQPQQQQQQQAVVQHVLAEMAAGHISATLLQHGVLPNLPLPETLHLAAQIMAAVLHTQTVPANAAAAPPTDPTQPEHVAVAAAAAGNMSQSVYGLGLALLLCLSPGTMLTFRQLHFIPHNVHVALNAVAPILVLLVFFVLCELQQAPPAGAGAAAAAAPVPPEAVLQAALDRLVGLAVQQDPPQPHQ